MIWAWLVRNALTLGGSVVTDALIGIFTNSGRVASRSPAPPKRTSQSKTFWFSDLLLSAAIWMEVLPLVSDGLETSQALGPYTSFALAAIALVVKALRFRTSSPAVMG